MALELPPELWMHIAQLIPPDELREFATVNRVFYELAMDALFREVSFIYPSPETFLRIVNRLRQVLFLYALGLRSRIL